MKISYTNLSPNNSGKRTHVIDTITPHCVVGQWTAKQIADSFLNPKRQASCNLGIGKDGDISLCVPITDRSWCSSNRANDQRSVTIECASDITHPYKMNEKVIESLINVMYELCRATKRTKIILLPTKEQRINYQPKSNEMKITFHRDFANKACPGDYLVSLMPEIVGKVNAMLYPTIYRVQTGAFRYKENALALKDTLKENGFEAIIKYDGTLYKVQIGAYGVYSNAEKMYKKLIDAGFDARIVK